MLIKPGLPVLSKSSVGLFVNSLVQYVQGLDRGGVDHVGHQTIAVQRACLHSALAVAASLLLLRLVWVSLLLLSVGSGSVTSSVVICGSCLDFCSDTLDEVSDLLLQLSVLPWSTSLPPRRRSRFILVVVFLSYFVVVNTNFCAHIC